MLEWEDIKITLESLSLDNWIKKIENKKREAYFYSNEVNELLFFFHHDFWGKVKREMQINNHETPLHTF